MSTDSALAIEQDTQETPAASYRFEWRNAARDDPRLGIVHMAVVQAYAEHCYAPKDAMRGVGVSTERLMFCTKAGERAVKGARADLVRWGWLAKIRNHGGGQVARYALRIPTAAPSTGAPSDPGKSAPGAPLDPGKSAPGAPIYKTYKPRPTYPPPGGAQVGERAAPDGPPRGRQEPPTTQRPAAAGAQSARRRDELAQVLPAGMLDSPRGARAALLLAAAFTAAVAAGWQLEQIRAELVGCDVGAREPVAVAVARLRQLEHRPPPVPVAHGPSGDQLDREALDAGRICAHGSPDRRRGDGTHRCPICRRFEAAHGGPAGVGA